MHQIYSCSDENIEVFTTVIPSKVTSPARRRVKSSQHLLTKNVVIESDLYAPRPLELLPHRTDRRDGEGRRSGRFQNPRLQGPHPAKTPARPVGTSEPKSANLCGNRTYGKALERGYPQGQQRKGEVVAEGEVSLGVLDSVGIRSQDSCIMRTRTDWRECLSHLLVFMEQTGQRYASSGPDLRESPHGPGGGSPGLGECSCADQRIQTPQEDD
ncbi:vexin isoform X1 [Ovis aries]|uniref:vexin isoform X1 n=1 Tax=Ovis aries TaxID=9940 RepID=UPI001C2E3D77|nr:vexin isoform X1 [Ovis aries]